MLFNYTTGNRWFAMCQSTRQRPKNTRQRICRVLHTVNSARQSSAGIQGVCRVPFFGHTAKPLPCVLSGPRQNKVTPSTQHATWAVCRVPHGQAHGKQCHLCRVPRGQAHGKEWQLCRVPCHGTRQKMVAHGKINFQIHFFCLITNISDSNQINITGNSYILHQMSRSFHISQFASHSIHRSPNANIANIAMHTSPNVVDTSPYKHW